MRKIVILFCFIFGLSAAFAETFDFSFNYLVKSHAFQKVEKLGNLETETGFKLYKTIDWEGNVNYTLVPMEVN